MIVVRVRIWPNKKKSQRIVVRETNSEKLSSCTFELWVVREYVVNRYQVFFIFIEKYPNWMIKKKNISVVTRIMKTLPDLSKFWKFSKIFFFELWFVEIFFWDFEFLIWFDFYLNFSKNESLCITHWIRWFS